MSLRHSLPEEIVVRSLNELHRQIYILYVKNILYDELNFNLGINIFLEIALNLIVEVYFSVEGKLQ